jgi:hypothetical protein
VTLPGKWRGQLGEAVSVATGHVPLFVTHNRNMRFFVQSKKLRKGEVEAGRDPIRHFEGRARPASLDLGQHRRAHTRVAGEIAQRKAHGLAQAPNSLSHSRR